MSDFNFRIGKQSTTWDENLIIQKLNDLTNVSKKGGWIQNDLSVTASSRLGRLLWVIAKHFHWMRKTFYHVDLEQSKNLLRQLQHKVVDADNVVLTELFKKAVKNFNQVAPHHAIKLKYQLQDIEEIEDISQLVQYYAIDLGLGYKAANLIVLKLLIPSINTIMQKCICKVPPFLPISSSIMRDHINPILKSLEGLWQEFLDSFDPVKRENFVNTNKNGQASSIQISERGKTLLKEIQKNLQTYFQQDPSQNYLEKLLAKWLGPHAQEFFIVRSTGKEDSETNANAGGNESIPFVKADIKEIFFAIGEVLSSYFSEVSISQRLGAHDKTLFTDTQLFLPVLLQVMVVEKDENIEEAISDLIPRSGVLLTREQGKSEGVTFIQTGPGNNEGIVASKVMVDSFFVDDQHHIHSVVREKETRIVSVKKGDRHAYTIIPNNDSILEKEQSLPDEILIDFKRIADLISKVYGKNEINKKKAMDVEYSSLLNGSDDNPKPVIYLFQTRPAKGKEVRKDPTYLNWLSIKDVKPDLLIPMTPLLDGGSCVREVKGPEEILLIENLDPQKLDVYFKAVAEGKNVKVIISSKSALATSHAAMTLGPKDVAVFVMEDLTLLDRLRKLISKSSKNSLFFDAQRGVAVPVLSVSKENQLILQGMISYPSPIELTVPLYPITAKAILHLHHPSKKVKGVLTNLTRTLSQEYHALKNKLVASVESIHIESQEEIPLNDLRVRLETMASGSGINAQIALSELLEFFHDHLLHINDSAQTYLKRNILSMCQVFEAMLHLAKNEMMPAFNRPAMSLERLYPLRFFECLMFQKPSRSIIDGFSYVSILEEKCEQQRGVQVGGKDLTFSRSATKFLELTLMALKAFTPECQENWNTFVKEIQNGSKGHHSTNSSRLRVIVREMNTMNIASLWLNIVFNSTWKEHENEENRAETVLNKLKSLNDAEKSTFDWLKEKGNLINPLEEVVFMPKANWEPERLGSLFIQQLGYDPKGIENPHSLAAKFLDPNLGKIGRLALLQFMDKSVTLFDQIVKNVNASCDSLDKLKTFVALLSTYFEMMQASLMLISNEDEKVLMATKWGDNKFDFKSFVEKLKEGTNYHIKYKEVPFVSFNQLMKNIAQGEVDLQEQLRESPQFNVSAITIDSKADLDFSVHWPSRVVEYFTLFHQNIDKVIKFLNTKNGMGPEILTGQAKNLVEQLGELGQKISSFSVVKSKVEVAYHIPLRQHSCKIVVKFDTASPDKGEDFQMQFFGMNEHFRWDQIATFAALLANKNSVTFSEGLPPQIQYGVSEVQSSGISFSLHFPPTWVNFKAVLVNPLMYLCMLPRNILEDNVNPQELCDKLMRHGIVEDWSDIKEGFYSDSFYLNTLLMDYFSPRSEGEDDYESKENFRSENNINSSISIIDEPQIQEQDDEQEAYDPEQLLKIAKNTLMGLAKRNLTDYRADVKPKTLKDFIGHDAYDFVPENVPGLTTTNSLKMVATLQLLRVLEIAPEKAKPVLVELIGDSNLQSSLPATVAALRRAFVKCFGQQEMI